MNLRRIYNFDFNSSLLRSILSLYYRPHRFYRIPFGPLAGLVIWYDRSINFHAILGLWERANFLALEKVLARLLQGRTRLQAYDIGANIGLYSLFLSRFSEKVKVFAFEPVAETVEHLHRNIEKNGNLNIEIIEKAAGNVNGAVTFYIGHHHKSSLEKDWTSDRGTTSVAEVKVPSLTLDSFVEENPSRSPDIIKIDVEGAGEKVLEGAARTLRTRRPIIIIESHAAYEDRAIIKMLAEFDYNAYRVNNGKWIKNPQNDYRDPDGVWGTMILFPRENSLDYFKS